MSHNPNPFDFVPFSDDAPQLKTIGEWRGKGRLLTGRIKVKLKALTPLHIVGRQESMEGEKIVKIVRSHFHRLGGAAVIPAASIRGMLRSFLEAACNGWVSQATPYYLKGKGQRHIGFMAVHAEKKLNDEQLEQISEELLNKTAIPERFLPPLSDSKDDAKDILQMKMDLCSFLFGMIDPAAGGWKGRIAIEDAQVPTVSWVEDAIPDISSAAFMGGGKPSASSWWYQHPYCIRKRLVKPKKGRPFILPEFLGMVFRGRKFYYHQNPRRCLEWYSDTLNWPVDSKRRLYLFPAECLLEGRESQPFNIYFEETPEPLIHLLLLILCPGKRIRHKLGYGKPYGYGSVEFEVIRGKLRGGGDWDPRAKLEQIYSLLWNDQELADFGVGGYLHVPSMEALAKILWWDRDEAITFTYPQFNAGVQINGGRGVHTVKANFLPVVKTERLLKRLTTSEEGAWHRAGQIAISDPRAEDLACALSRDGLRSALHFGMFQKTAQGYQRIQSRRLADA